MPVALARCRCRVPHLAALREALELTQDELATILEVTARWIRMLEAALVHRCLSPHAVANLRMALVDPHFRSLLKDAHYPHPYPEDLGNTWFPGLKVGARCRVEGIPLKIHARCVACMSLAGPGHRVMSLDNTKLCESCRAAIAAGTRARER